MSDKSEHLSPKVSFVSINYNGGELLEQCLASVQQSVHSVAYEIIVVDDGSTDGSAEMIHKKFPSVHLLVNDKEMFSNVSLNRAIGLCKGEYVYFLMPDTLLTGGTLEKLLEFMKKNREVHALTSKTSYPDGRFQQGACRDNNLKFAFLNYTFLGKLFPKLKKKFNDIYAYAGWNWNENHEIENTGFTNMLVRRSVFDSVGIMDLCMKMYFAENDFCMRIRQRGGKIYYVAEGNVIHHLRGAVKKSVKKIAKIYEQDIFHFFKKYYGFSIAYTLRILIWISNILLSMRERKPMRLLEIFLVEPEKS